MALDANPSPTQLKVPDPNWTCSTAGAYLGAMTSYFELEVQSLLNDLIGMHEITAKMPLSCH